MEIIFLIIDGRRVKRNATKKLAEKLEGRILL